MNANTLRVALAFIVINALVLSRGLFNIHYLDPELLSYFSANGIFKILYFPLEKWFFQLSTAVYYLSGLFFLLSLNSVSLLLFFLSGIFVDNFQVNFPDGGHSRYLLYAVLLQGLIAIFTRSSAKLYLTSYRSLIAAFYFVAALQKVTRSGFNWTLDDSIFVFMATLQERTVLKDWLLDHYPMIFQVGAYSVFLLELFSPFIVVSRWARIPIVFGLCAFHLFLPLVWGGHGGFNVNCICLLICLADEKIMQMIISKLMDWRTNFIDAVYNLAGHRR